MYYQPGTRHASDYMQDTLNNIHRLSSSRASERKKAIQDLRRKINHPKGHLARLALHYVARHDPSWCVRNLAKQAFYLEGSEPEEHEWERAYLF